MLLICDFVTTRLSLPISCRYYADLEKKKCPDTTTPVSSLNATMDPNVTWLYLLLFRESLFLSSRSSNNRRVSYGGALPSELPHKQPFNWVSITFHLNSICSLWETTQTLFWAVFGLVDLDSFELDGIKIFTRFWGMLMFGCYSVINIVVLLNLLIAMMNHSYQLISVGTKT